jgi:lipoprotein NlpD
VEPRAGESRSAESHASEANSAAANAGGASWVWPTDRVSAPRAVPGGGILLLGSLGQDIRAAGPGRVVYIGSGLRGYGNLIIIKHGNNLLSSYAHNREMLVHEGQDVTVGQIIAHMGTGPHQVSALYFEIRVNGKPVDPLTYLPER